MFSNIVTVDPSPTFNKNRSLSNIYQRFQSLLGRGADIDLGNCVKEDMLSARGSTVASEDSFITPVSSVDDLMALSPRGKQAPEPADVTSDLLTGEDFDSVCEITMQPAQHYDDPLYIDPSSDYLVNHGKESLFIKFDPLYARQKRQDSTPTGSLPDSVCEITMQPAQHYDDPLYIDPSSDYLVNHGKESLFIKFDPLYARQKRQDSTPTGSLPDSTEVDVGYETGSAASILAENSVATLKRSMSAGSIACALEKPTQVVLPVKNDLPKTTVMKATPQLVRSASAIISSGHVATDRLINFIGSTPPVAAPRSPHHRTNTHQVDRIHSIRLIIQKQEREILSLRQENADLKSVLHTIKSSYACTVKDFLLKVKKLIDKQSQLYQQLQDKNLNNKQMCKVVEEYEKTISALIVERQREQQLSLEMEHKLRAERDQALSHLSSIESSFYDLLSKYEKCKVIIIENKDREELYEQKMTEYQAGLKKYEEIYVQLKQVTAESLAKANETHDSMKKNHSTELKKLNATIQKNEIKITSLEESLTQKTRDNEELTRICDQLIKEVH